MLARGFDMKKTISLLLALAFCAVCVPSVLAQQKQQTWTTASRYTVVQGDSVPSIVKKLKYPSVTESQMYFAVVQANINNFSTNTVDRVLPRMRLNIPLEAEVARVDVKMADNYMAQLRKAEVIFAEGVAAEDKDDMRTAVEKYIAAAKVGHAYAQFKLGQLYDRDTTRTLPHDFQESMKYYYEARKRGKEIQGPIRQERNQR